MASKTSFVVCVCVALLVAHASVWAQGPIVNPSFEQGTDPWTKYSYQPGPGANPVEPGAGCVGPPPCRFDRLSPPTIPDGSNVCGIQSYETTGNGGVCQSFTWSGGPASVSVWARVYSEKYDGTPRDNGCLVRMGLANSAAQDRAVVASWTTFAWSSNWLRRTVAVPGAGTYTLFIEAYQPDSSVIMSTLWDKVEFVAQPPVLVTAGPNVSAGDPQHPDTSVTITWTTNVASTSRVDYGPTPSMGSYKSDAALTANHGVTLVGLSHSSQYYFRATSTAAGRVDWVSDDLIFRTPIWFSDIKTKLSSSGADTIIDWTTDVPTTSQVEYWSDVDPHTFTTEMTSLTTSHEVALGGLVQGRQYSFRVWSRNQPYYSDAASQVNQFWTLPPVSVGLANAGFEDTHGAEGHSIYPWVQYVTREGVSGYHPIDGLVGPYPAGGPTSWYAGVQAHGGSYFLGAAANAAYKNGGVFQRVVANPGDFYTVTARYLTYRSGGENRSTKVRIGIDPDGGVDPSSASIRWWTGYSDTNDNQWHPAAVTVTAGETGVATVFLEFIQILPIEWHVAAIDAASFGPPLPISIGALKASTGSLGAVLEDKIVTYASPSAVWLRDRYYNRAYVQEANRTSGVEVIFPPGATQLPVAGNKMTVTGALGVYDKEAALMAESWTIDNNTYPLPRPLAMSQASIGKSGPNQPAIFANSFGLCNVGLRVRAFGRVTLAAYGGLSGDRTVYIDDGRGLHDAGASAGSYSGIRAYLYDKLESIPYEGDYIAVTGVCSVQLIDPNEWPGDGDEYYTYALLTNGPDDWDVLWTSFPTATARTSTPTP